MLVMFSFHQPVGKRFCPWDNKDEYFFLFIKEEMNCIRIIPIICHLSGNNHHRLTRRDIMISFCFALIRMTKENDPRMKYNQAL